MVFLACILLVVHWASWISNQCFSSHFVMFQLLYFNSLSVLLLVYSKRLVLLEILFMCHTVIILTHISVGKFAVSFFSISLICSNDHSMNFSSVPKLVFGYIIYNITYIIYLYLPLYIWRFWSVYLLKKITLKIIWKYFL